MIVMKFGGSSVESAQAIERVAGIVKARADRKRETRERIVAAAAELMSRRGVAGTTIEDIQEAAAVSTSQMYHYFADKGDLVAAVIDFPTDQFISGRHAQVQALGNRFTLSDIGSKNGTFVRLNRERALNHGDYVFIGQQLLRVEIT